MLPSPFYLNFLFFCSGSVCDFHFYFHISLPCSILPLSFCPALSIYSASFCLHYFDAFHSPFLLAISIFCFLSLPPAPHCDPGCFSFFLLLFQFVSSFFTDVFFLLLFLVVSGNILSSQFYVFSTFNTILLPLCILRVNLIDFYQWSLLWHWCALWVILSQPAS